MARILFLSGLLLLTGCAIHRQPPLTPAQRLLLHTPPTINRAPTPQN